MGFNIHDKVMVTLKEQGYFDPWDIRREVPILSQSQMENQLLELREPAKWSKSYKQEQFMKKSILAIKHFAGIYVGDRGEILKVRPFYGLQHPWSDYFIVNENQIDEIGLYRVTMVDKSTVSSSRKIQTKSK